MMSKEKNYKKINKESWNNKVEIHVSSDFYDNENFIAGKNSLNQIELDLLGDLNGKSVLHLQCHFGQDTISLTRLGAKATGIDFSDKAIKTAKDLSLKTNSDAEFICSDIYELIEKFDEKFDFVFTSYGTIGWLPDMNKWAKVISHFLKANGKLVFVEFHPVVWMFDHDFQKVKYNYSNSGAIMETYEGSYADNEADIQLNYVMWNHGIGEVVNSLVGQNLQIETLNEYDYSPYNCFKHTIEFEPGKFRIKHFDDKIPMVYAIVATKNK